MEIRIYADASGRYPFEEWLNGLKDIKARARIRARIVQIEAGNFGDCKSLREGIQELRIDHGPGYRVYLSRQGKITVLLLCGSNKRDQDRAIEKAIGYLKDWKRWGRL